ncbi:MAG: hypothetical protein PHU85_15815 [Phycisphaerae bacterium]|nr:hypothetical protein [Phycisphaerae bacterium]
MGHSLARASTCAVAVAILVGLCAPVSADPIIPGIDYLDIQFGTKALTYSFNGTADDTLVGSASLGGEATAYYTPWPMTDPDQEGTPLYYRKLTGGTMFGADVSLNFKFTSATTPPVPGTVSLNGVGGNANGDDFVIVGTTAPTGGTNVVLWAMEVTNVALYGYIGESSLILEAVGTVTASALDPGLVGSLAVIRGHADANSPLPSGYTWPDGYAPDKNVSGSRTLYYSGETGPTPEPATIAFLALGGLAMIRGHLRRRHTA